MEIIISIISLIVAIFALGWNFYRDVIQKPKIKVSFGVYSIANPTNAKIVKEVINFSIVNFGPGDIMISNIIIKNKRNSGKYSIIIPNFDWSKLPQKISVGEQIQVITDYFDKCFLHTNFYKAGIIDSYGRKHWAPKKDVKYAKKIYFNNFAVKM